MGSPVVLISGDDGIAPVLSMLGTLCADGDIGPVGLLHYGEDRIHPQRRSQLDALTCDCGKVRIRRVNADRIAEPGPFRSDHLDALGPWHADAEAFVCGPPELEAAVMAHYVAIGRAAQVHTEIFRLVDTPAIAQGTGTVRFARSGVEATNGGTLLERAEACGVRAPFGCRVGICDTCMQVKVRGRTRNLRTGQVDDDEDVEIHMCVSVPEGEVILDL